ncbi:MAG: DNA-directed RNA polymerase subunit omega [Ichthyobacteriaceae bacterium]|nr:DNA-directed RNA polymerase subunit omega [Ichthyobacteriaceae bacterium]
MDYKKSNAAVSTITRDRNQIDKATENLYESIVIIAKRANQINADIKKELIEKLEEFASDTDSLEEVFENNEQIEVSRFYERLPKAHAIAVEEWLNDKIYFRNTQNDNATK